MNYLIALLVMLSLLFVAPFPADAAASFRCGGRIIDVGQSRDFVFHKCGQPTNIEERTGRLATNFIQRYPEDHERYNYMINKNQIEVWTYNLVLRPKSSDHIFGNTSSIRSHYNKPIIMACRETISCNYKSFHCCFRMKWV